MFVVISKQARQTLQSNSRIGMVFTDHHSVWEKGYNSFIEGVKKDGYL